MAVRAAILALELAAVFGGADYVTGRDLIKKAGLPGRSIYYTGPVVIALLTAYGYGAGHPWPWALLGVAWAAWRSVLGWSSFGGALDPKGDVQELELFARNLVSSTPTAIVLGWDFLPSERGLDWLIVACWATSFSSYATLCNMWLTAEARKGHDVDPEVDLLHGLGYGASIALVIAVGRQLLT